jgi:integrase/recombinase XerD
LGAQTGDRFNRWNRTAASARPGLDALPAIIRAQGERARRRFIEFLPRTSVTATRAAYARAVKQFFDWTDKRRLELHEIEAITVAAYIEQLGTSVSKPTVKKHLAAIRRLFDYLTIGGILAANPASAVRGPKYVVQRGQEPRSVGRGSTQAARLNWK